jgi:argininosuccinate lyase
MAKKMWGGRFKKKIEPDFYLFQKSVQYDYKLAEYDIYHSMIHISALVLSKVLTVQEANQLEMALVEILNEIKKGKFKYNPHSEDIHTEIQNRLEAKFKDTALKLHSFRSRNDQVVFDEKYYCVHQGLEVGKLIAKVFVSLSELSARYKNSFFVGYTHTRRAQVIKFSNYVLSFGRMLERDLVRVENFCKNIEISIGSGALAGSYIQASHYNNAIEGFVKKFFHDFPFKISLVKNSLENVSSRDFIIEFLNILAILQMHLSRMAEDFILYSTKEFNYLDLPEEFCTGSSYMPHKKNPDFLELVRGYTSRIYGNLVALLTLMKGLPLTYNRDMQLDKEPLFSSVEIVKAELEILAKFIKGIRLNEGAIEKAIEDESIYATELAEYLVGKGVPFKKAHDIVGRLVRHCEDEKLKLTDMVDEILKGFSPHLKKKEIVRIVNPSFAVESKRSLKKK